MKKYLIFIGTFLLSFVVAGIFLIGIMKLIDDTNPGFINTPPSMVVMFIVFLAIPSLVAYYVAFEFKKSKKKVELEIEHDHEKGVEVEKPSHHKKESHWLFALIATFVILGAIIGFFVLLPGVQWEPYSFTSIDENSEFQKIPKSEPILETSNSGEINDWKTYQTPWGFSFQYPPSLVVDQRFVGDPNTPGLKLNDPNRQWIFINNVDSSNRANTFVTFHYDFDLKQATSTAEIRNKVITQNQREQDNKEVLTPEIYLRKGEAWILNKDKSVIYVYPSLDQKNPFQEIISTIKFNQ